MFDRTWQVQEHAASGDAEVGTVSLSIDISNLPVPPGDVQNFYLISDTDTDFTTGSSIIVATSFVDNVITFSNLSEDVLDNLTYFTLGCAYKNAPGNEVANLSLWLNATTGITLVSDEVTAWQDQSINYVSFDEVFAGDEPQYVQESINFNAGIEFNATNERLGKSDYEFFPEDTFTTFVVFTREDFADTQETLFSYAA